MDGRKKLQINTGIKLGDCCEFNEHKGTRVYQNGKELYKSNYQFDEEESIWSVIEEKVE